MCKESRRWMKCDLVTTIDFSCLFEKGIKLLCKRNWHTLRKFVLSSIAQFQTLYSNFMFGAPPCSHFAFWRKFTCKHIRKNVFLLLIVTPIKENKMGTVCSMKSKIPALNRTIWSKSLKERDHLEEISIDGRFILIFILWNMKCIWTWFVWLEVLNVAGS
jgi:hypothetical protein